MSKTYRVEARRWSGGWELHIADEGVTQVRTLADARAQVIDYLETMHDGDFSNVEVEVMPDLDGLEVEVVDARREVVAAARAQEAAAAHSREVAKKLRASGLSVTDTAAVLGVSRGRVSQLVA